MFSSFPFYFFEAIKTPENFICCVFHNSVNCEIFFFSEEIERAGLQEFHFWKKSSIVKRTEKYKSQNLIL